ncbi:MAG: hypothetical protein V2J02_12090 [Pseudomonadales bacterium]|jgi:hypothetical protein|nr:hypothetical protein [Pseudomonadales bacterium]
MFRCSTGIRRAPRSCSVPVRSGDRARRAAPLLLCLGLCLLLLPPVGASERTWPAVGYHPGALRYWSVPYAANAMWIEQRGWRVRRPEPGGRPWEFLYEDPAPDQVDALGNPRYVAEGSTLLAQPGQNSTHRHLLAGRVVLTWQGDGDVRIANGRFVKQAGGEGEVPVSNGPARGLLRDGVRVYEMNAEPNGIEVEVVAVGEDRDGPGRLRAISAWLADPETGASLRGQRWHPAFSRLLRDRPWGHLRTMDLTDTNASPQRDWADRRRPQHLFQAGVLNDRSPAPGVKWYTGSDGSDRFYGGNRETGMAWEHLVALANEHELDLWINVPHLATDDYVRRLARLIRFGAGEDGEPHAGPVDDPAYAPLDPALRVFVEYSNEIWSGGNEFPQGEWAKAAGREAGLSKPQFNARRFVQLWSIFEEVFEGPERLVKVAAIWAGQEGYSGAFLEEIARYGARQDPPQRPDLVAPTTYFGNGIQAWAHEEAIRRAGTDDPWFYGTERFGEDDRPVSLPEEHRYWRSDALARHLDETVREWLRRMLGGAQEASPGPDETAHGGGFGPWLRPLVRELFGEDLPIVAYEGGPSLYTDRIDQRGVREDDGITRFVIALNRHPGFEAVYRTHLELATAAGLTSHMMYLDVSPWGSFGQWGHLERIDQGFDAWSKFRFLREWAAERGPVTRAPAGPPDANVWRAAPVAPGRVGQALTQLVWPQGEVPADTRVELISAVLVDGLEARVERGRLVVSGTPRVPGESLLFARVDAPEGPSWILTRWPTR